jgi:dipeptidyl aminopeptidase
MHTPQHNVAGYDNSSITDVQSLSKNVRFLIMHGVADDNVHMQNTLTLLDKLDLAGVENYDVHVFPDSDHSIYFHNANRIVYDSKNRPKSRLLEHILTTCRTNMVAHECIQWRMASH